MAPAIYFPLFLVLVGSGRKSYSIFYLAADPQEPSTVSAEIAPVYHARRAGWEGSIYDLRTVRSRFIRLG
jgi:hypothetical protein